MDIPELDEREMSILKLVAAGESNIDIAEHLHIHLRTATYHLGKLMEKLGARNRTHLVAMAYQKGVWRNVPGTLPEIPPEKSLSLGKMPYFISHYTPRGVKQWFVVAPEEAIPEGGTVEVNRYGDTDGRSKEPVIIRHHEYERVVHRGKENERRYIMASFDKEGW